MSTRRRPSASGILGAIALVAALSSAALAGPPSSPVADPGFRVAYPMTAPTSVSSMAGVELAALHVDGMHLAFRQDEPLDEGGVSLSFADLSNEVRAVIRVVVTRDATTARRLLDRELHGIARILPEMTPTALGDLVYGDEGRGDVVVAATVANVLYVVRAIPEGNASITVPTAATIAADVRAAMRAGTPIFPTPSVSLPKTIAWKSGGEITVATGAGQTPKLRGEGAYVSRGPSAPLLRPFAKGPVAVVALVVDELGRVGTARAESIAL